MCSAGKIIIDPGGTTIVCCHLLRILRVIIEDSYVYGPDLMGATGDLTATVAFIGGLSVPFDVMGFKLHVGGDLRPMIRVHAPISNTVANAMLTALADGNDLLSPLNSADALYGVGIGLDLGAIADLGWLQLGLSIRDLGGTQFKYNKSTFGTLSSTFLSFGRPLLSACSITIIRSPLPESRSIAPPMPPRFASDVLQLATLPV